MAQPTITVERIHPKTVGEQMNRTVGLVAKAVREGSTYLPLRQHAAQVAARGAAPKDFLGHLRALYADFVKRWRYVRDPHLAEMVVSSAPALWSVVWGGGNRQGVGDCDDATAAFGAGASALGFPVRLVTSVPLRHAHNPRLRTIPGHIYPEVFVKPHGWIPADPVVWPKHGLGYAAPALRRYRFDLWGRPLGASLQGAEEREEEEIGMYGRTDDIGQWQDYGLAEYGYAMGGADEDMGAAPLDWSVYGLAGFGAAADRVYDASAMGLLAEVETDGYGLARTPMVEMSADDIAYVRQYGRPYDGMLGLGDDGSVYQWQPTAGLALGGFFKKLFKGIGHAVKGIAKGAFKLAKKGLKFAKKLIAKLPGGKYLVRFMDKIHKVAMKLVRPLAKILGPLASKLAPIAAMIPGYGPVISVALKAGGTIAKLMAKHGVRQTPKGALVPHSHAGMMKFKAALKAEAAKKRAELKAKRAKMDPKLIPAGTPEHEIALRALGVKLPPAPIRRHKAAKAAAAPVEFAW